jgi:malate synthase
MSAASRVNFANVEGASEVFTNEFVEYLAAAHDAFTSKLHDLRSARAGIRERAVKGDMPAHPDTSDINTGDWKVPAVPDELRTPGIEISGPASLTSMFINALNPGPDGQRGEGDLDDDEDSAGHRLVDTVAAALNRKHAVEGTLVFEDERRGRKYEVKEGPIPFFMHRERGIHLDEHDVTVDGTPVPAALLGMALTLFHAGRAQINRGQGLYWYLPKLESADEAGFYREFLDFSTDYLKIPSDAVIRAIILVESLPAVYEMEEMLHALGPYAAGLNAARWDLKASILEYIMTDPNAVWPDRFGVDIKTTEFISNIFRRLVAVCLKRGAVPIGGMATALPDKDPEVNEAAGESIRGDKVWEAQQGFLRGWVAHIFHMTAAAQPFKELRGSGWQPSADMADPDRYPVALETPDGPITIEGTRRNIRTMIEYLEGWLAGRGAKGIDSLEGRPGTHPRLMEDLATARISVAQTAQRILHAAADSDSGEVHDFQLVKGLVQQELADILRLRDEAGQDAAARARYTKAGVITVHWIKSYTELNFRSLGSYTRADLDAIAAAPEAF